MQIPLLPIETKSFFTANGKTLETELILLPYDILITDFCDGAKQKLLDCFLPETEIFYLVNQVWQKSALSTLPDCSCVFLQKQSFLNKRRFSYHDAVEILSYLRSPNGCPWDRAQTSVSIRTNIIEEAYELVDAIDLESTPKMTEEVGDLFLQSIFVCLMEKDKGAFDFGDVFDGLCTKLITRHTHIFGQDSAQDDGDALNVWEANKQKEKKFTTYSQNLTDVPQGMPALMRAQKVGKRASKAGFDWQNADGIVIKCLEEISEVLQAVGKNDRAEIEEEIGDLLFSVANLCRFLDVSAEVALLKATSKFILRFKKVEELLLKQNKKFSDCSAEYLDKLWQEAKQGG